MSSFKRPQPSSGDPHGWNSLDHYVAIHYRCLDERAYFIVESTLHEEIVGNRLTISGRLECNHGLFLDVTKNLEINDCNQVRTRYYSYHAGVLGNTDRTIFRYDNAHQYVREGHEDAHHKHRHDHQTWQEIEPPEWIGHDRWPVLSAVIDELEDWWNQIGRTLPGA